MKTKLFILVWMLFASLTVFSQDQIPLYWMEKAPGADYIPVSDGDGIQGYVHRSHLGLGGGTGWLKDSLNAGHVLIDANGNTFTIVDLTTFSVRDQDGIGVDYNITAPSSEGQALIVERTDAQGTSGFELQHGRFLFKDTSGTYTLEELARGGIFYHYPGAGNSYSLPLDTLRKYDVLTITMRNITGPSPTLTLPQFPADSIFNGKTIVIHFEGSEDADSIFVEAAGLSQLVQIDCYAKGKTIQSDTIISNQDNDPGPNLIVYHTSYQDDYVRQCEGLITLSDGNVVLPGDTLPNLSRKTIPYQISQYGLTQLTNPIAVRANNLVSAIDADILELGDGRLAMFFLASDSNTANGLEEYFVQYSDDGGFTWYKESDVSFFSPDKTPGALDYNLWEYNILIEDATNWKLYYHGKESGANGYQTFLATSSDAGQTWTRQGIVLPYGGAGEWDDEYAGTRSVFKYGGLYWMYYEGTSSIGANNFKAGVATSTDGITWTKYAGNPILEMDPASFPHEEASQGLIPYVEMIDDTFIMFYGDNDALDPDNSAHTVNLAESTDGFNFTKYEGNPIIRLDSLKEEWNNNNNTFIAVAPSPSGGFFMITRGTSTNTSKFPGWDNGLYYLGENFLAPNAYPIGQRTLGYSKQIIPNEPYTFYVNQNQFEKNDINNVSPIVGDPNRPFRDIWSAADTLNTNGLDSFIVIANNANWYKPESEFLSNLHRNLCNNAKKIRYDLRNTELHSQDGTLAYWNDIEGVFVSAVERDFMLTGRNSTVYLNNAGLFAGFYHKGSKVFIDLDKVISTGLRPSGPGFSGVQFGASNVNFNVNEFQASEALALTVWNAMDSMGTVSERLSRDITFNVGKYRNSNTATFVLQHELNYLTSTTRDSLSNITWNIDDYITQGTVIGFAPSSGDTIIGSRFIYNLKDVECAYLGGLSGAQSKPVLRDCHIGINSDYLQASVQGFSIYPSDPWTLDSSSIIVNYGLAKYPEQYIGASVQAPTSASLGLVNGSTITVSCDDCQGVNHVGSDLSVGDGTGSIIFDGNFRVDAGPVINIPGELVDTLILKGVYKNDGNSPAVQSATPVKIYTAGAYISGPSDPNVTIVELGDPSFEISITGATTNGSGDITVPHSLGTADINVNVTARGTALRLFTIHSKTTADFTVRFYDSSGTPLGAGTNMDFDVQAKKQ